MPRPKVLPRSRITVFCASSPNGEKEGYYLQLAETFGRRLAEEGFDCANGGSWGMMTTLSKGVFEAGGDVKCVNLRAYPPDHRYYHGEPELHTLLSDRQMALLAQGDGFVALPGGVGTLFEIAEVLARMALKEIPGSKPLICVGEEWNLLRLLLECQMKNGLVFANPFEFIYFVPDIESTIDLLKSRLMNQS